uniref:phage tail-collar fiber domain-containing protein n=1 Tax=Pseudodesulfovibrio pelocollis TaxID=3051432 RepID=UPI00255AF55E
MSTYFCLLTESGRAAVANAVALNQAVALAQMAVGDGGGTLIAPQASMTGLVGEVYRAPVNTVFVNPDDPGHVIAELVIPNNQGGWTVREVGLMDADGNLFAVGSVPASVKPATGEGAGAEMTVRMHLVMSTAEAGTIQIKVDPTVVLATRQYVVQSIADHAAAGDAHPDKADVDHTHGMADVSGLGAALASKAEVVHTHLTTHV